MSTENLSPQSNSTNTTVAAAKNIAPVGKKSRNALRHGIYSNEVMLPWEAEQEFVDLYSDFKKEWRPMGCTEEEAVFDLAHLTWIKRRAMKMPHLVLHSDPFSRSLVETGKTSWDDILEHQTTASDLPNDALLSTTAMLKIFEEMVKKLRAVPFDPDTAEGKATQMDIFHLTHKIDNLSEALNQKIVPVVQKCAGAIEGNRQRFNQTYDPNWIDQQVRSLGHIDARIEKIVRHLITVKEYKRIANPQHNVAQLPAAPSLVPKAGALAPPSQSENSAMGLEGAEKKNSEAARKTS